MEPLQMKIFDLFLEPELDFMCIKLGLGARVSSHLPYILDRQYD